MLKVIQVIMLYQKMMLLFVVLFYHNHLVHYQNLIDTRPLPRRMRIHYSLYHSILYFGQLYVKYKFKDKYLSSSLATTILSTFYKTGIPISPNYSIIQTSTIDISHTAFRICSLVILNKTKATRCFLVLIETHDNTPNVATF